MVYCFVFICIYVYMGKVVNGLFVKSFDYGMVFILTVGTL